MLSVTLAVAAMGASAAARPGADDDARVESEEIEDVEDVEEIEDTDEVRETEAGETEETEETVDFGGVLDDLGIGGGDGQTDTDTDTGDSAPVQANFVFRGWSRTTGWLNLTGQAVLDAPDEASVPYSRYGADQYVYLQSRYARGDHFEVVTSGLFTYRVGMPTPRVGGEPVTEEPPIHHFEPSLHEAYLAAYRDRVDVRLGQQRIPWGNSDAFAPNDVINASDSRDLTQTEAEVQHVPTLAARTDLALGAGFTLQGVAQPFFTPDKVDVYGTRWALVQQDAPLAYRRMLGSAWLELHPTARPAVQPFLLSTERPMDDLSGASGGASLRKTGGRLDFGLYYHYGFDTAPLLAIDPQFAMALESLPPEQVSGAALDALIADARMRGVEPVTASYVRRHHVGGSAQMARGSFVFRVDAAYDSRKVFLDSALQGVVRPALQAVVGIEYQTGELDKSVLIEGQYMVIDDAPADGTLLGKNRENYALAYSVKWPLGKNLGLESTGMLVRDPMSYTVRAELVWKEDALALHTGALLLGGDPTSLGHYYRHNQSAYTSLEVSF